MDFALLFHLTFYLFLINNKKTCDIGRTDLMDPHSCPFTGFSFTENQRGEATASRH